MFLRCCLVGIHIFFDVLYYSMIVESKFFYENMPFPLIILDLVNTLDIPVGLTYISRILRGSKSKRLVANNLHESPYYGIFMGYNNEEIKKVIDTLIINGYLYKKYSSTSEFLKYVLYVSEKGKKALLNKKDIPIDVPTRYYSTELFGKLKDWRRNKATELKLPAYCIFLDSTLIHICLKLPRTVDDLKNINGFGKITIEKYGSEILERVCSFISNQKNLQKEYGESGDVCVINTHKNESKFEIDSKNPIVLLGNSNNEDSILQLIEYTKSKNASDRRLSASALGKLSRFNPKIYVAVPSLIRLLSDEAPQVRLYAINALGKIKDARAKDELENLLFSDDKEYNIKAAKRALREIGVVEIQKQENGCKEFKSHELTGDVFVDDRVKSAIDNKGIIQNKTSREVIRLTESDGFVLIEKRHLYDLKKEDVVLVDVCINDMCFYSVPIEDLLRFTRVKRSFFNKFVKKNKTELKHKEEKHCVTQKSSSDKMFVREGKNTYAGQERFKKIIDKYR